MPSLNRDGVALYYEERGGGDPPLLFVHGWCCDHTFFAHQVQRFGLSHRVVAVDLRGHGQSDKPEQDYTMAAFADELAWLCGELGLVKPVVIGHSMGGDIALDLARRFPDLPAALVLLDAPIVRPPAQGASRQTLIQALRGPDYREVARQWAGSAYFLPADDPETKARIVDAMSSAPQHVMVSTIEHIVGWDGPAAAPACQAPVLNLSSAHPLNDLARLQELCPQWAYGQAVGAGHFFQLLVPEQVNAMIERFLEIYVPAKQIGA